MKSLLKKIKSLLGKPGALAKNQIMVKVTQKNSLAEKITCIRLEPLNRDNPLPHYSPGDHIDVHIPNGEVRQYSLCSVCSQSEYYEIAVQLEENGKGGSKAIHENVQLGDTLVISSPKHLFPFNETNEQYLFIAAGIGLTPLLSMVETAKAQGKPFDLHYCVRNEEDIIFKDRLSAFGATYHVSSSGSRIQLAKELSKYPTTTDIYVCGPNQFMDEVFEQATSLGWEKGNLHREYFSPPEQKEFDNKPFDVQLNSTGEIFTISKDESIVDVLDKNSVYVPISCREGICGTCVTSVVEGEVEHRDFFLSDDEKAEMKKVALCCSRAKGELIKLDL